MHEGFLTKIKDIGKPNCMHSWADPLCNPTFNSHIKDHLFLQLNDVASGGRTVFPRIGAGVAPVAGSAVFWYNLFPSGDADQLTLHGACPVLYGTKWGKNT